MSQTGQKIKNNDVIEEMARSGLFRVRSDGRVETRYQWRACREYYDRPWFVCDRPDGKGYYYISFRHKRIKAHRLAYMLYTGVNPGQYEINHLDGNRLNNRLENLELCDARRQSKHAFDTGLNPAKGEKNHNAKLSENDVREIRKRASEGAQYTSIAKDFNITPTCARYVCIRHTWKHIE